jgi:hypothetical protein
MTGKKVTLAKAFSLATLLLLSKRLHGLAAVTGCVTRLLLNRRKGVMLG